nr:hypothetical protein [Tanacetum cinerariifolium]
MVEEVTSMKKDFKHKENKYLEDFLDMKSLNEKVKDRLFKQDQSLQTVHMLCRPKPYYNELNKVAIGYKNPLCLTHTKKVQPALYNGHEIIKDNHVPAIVHNTKYTLEIAEITRRKMNDKMKDPEYLVKMKSKALKEQTTVSRPIKALTVYPPKFDNTCKKRITPTGLTEGERGFEQTKACYLKEIIPFFQTLKEIFKGIQKALTKEIKDMKDIFEELEAKVSQNVADRKHDAIERKNLLIANDNLIAECLSKEVFSVAMNSELNVARFTEMHVSHTIVETRCLDLEAKLSNLRDKSHNDNLDELVNHFSNLETLGCSPHYLFFENTDECVVAMMQSGYLLKAKILENFNQQLILEYSLVMQQPGKGPTPNFMTPGQISLGLVPNLVYATPYVPPTNKDLEILFQPMFEEYLEPPRVERPVSPAQAVQASVNSAAEPTFMGNNPVAPVDNNPLLMYLLKNLVLTHHHPGMLVQQNQPTSLKHIIISANGANITRSIMSLAILLS